MNQTLSSRPEIGQVSWLDQEIAEISLLIPAWEAAELVTMASFRNVTVGQMLRALIREYLLQQDAAKEQDASEARVPHLWEQGGANG